MGYETQLLVGKATDMEFQGKKYFMVYATVDMSKMGYDSAVYDLPWKNENTDDVMWEWYAPTGDGDIAVCQDRYGDYPQPVPVGDVIEALRTDSAGDDYRRFKWALALLEAMEKDTPEGLSVILWGY